jgi:2-oxoglutarate ferredoxin oxidoreductase subunit delta
MVKITIDEVRCKGCGLCVRACPKKIMQLSPTHLNAKGYHPAECTDLGACIACAACARTCPDAVVTIEKD